MNDVLILGAARSGVAAANFLAARERSVVISDASPEEKLPLVKTVDARVRKVFGGHPLELLDGVDTIVLSPGVPANIPLLREARERGIPIISEVELAYRNMRGKIIAITGTNGKSTTTALTGEILRQAGSDPVVAGNIGQPLISVVDERPRVYVLELSSFQLETVETFRPDVAVLLNITPDHLDRYDSMDDYAAAKYRIFARQTEEDVAVVNADDPRTSNPPTKARVWSFSSIRRLDRGAYRRGEDIVVQFADERQRIARAALRLPGDANVENAMAAWLAARAVGVPSESVERAFRGFEGLRHRMQLVREIDGVRYVNDSKGTNVDATYKSLQGLPDGSVWLILGGKDKHGEFERLRELVRRKVKAILTIGEASAPVEAALRGTVEIVSCGELAPAIDTAASRAQQGETVLLSPACASFDQYENFEKRGEHFEQLVSTLRPAVTGGAR